MANFYISDQHFGHKNVLKFDSRPFETIDEHDQFLIDAHNRVVSKDDDVYMLGDVVYGASKDPDWYISKLNGNLHLIIGNHDGEGILRDSSAKARFVEIEKMLFVKDNGRKIVLCHFPILEYNGYHKGAYHFYGHIHTRKDRTYEIMKDQEKSFNVGAPILDYTPAKFEQVVKMNQEYIRNSSQKEKEDEKNA